LQKHVSLVEKTHSKTGYHCG